MSAFSQPMKNRLKVLLFTAPLLVPLFTFGSYHLVIRFISASPIGITSVVLSFIGLRTASTWLRTTSSSKRCSTRFGSLLVW